MKPVWFLLLLLLVGLTIVALPDNDVRLFSLSNDHGPSLQDGVGLLFIFIAYGLLAASVWKQRQKLLALKASRFLPAALFLFGLGIGLIMASVMNDYQWWWVCGIVLLVLVQAIVFYIALK